MKRFSTVLVAIAIFIGFSMGAWAQDTLGNRILPGYLALQGAAIAGIWTLELVNKEFPEGFFRAKEDNVLYWPHVFAEYATAAGLVASAYGLSHDKAWGRDLALVSVGALAYTSLNSLNWALAEPDRKPFAIPMFIGLTGAGFSLGVLF